VDGMWSSEWRRPPGTWAVPSMDAARPLTPRAPRCSSRTIDFLDLPSLHPLASQYIQPSTSGTPASLARCTTETTGDAEVPHGRHPSTPHEDGEVVPGAQDQPSSSSAPPSAPPRHHRLLKHQAGSGTRSDGHVPITWGGRVVPPCQTLGHGVLGAHHRDSRLRKND
jgi:hypothetical protein